MLCATCETSCNALLTLSKGLDASGEGSARKTRIIGQTARELLDSIALDCDLCWMFWTAAPEEYRHDVRADRLEGPFVSHCDIAAIDDLDPAGSDRQLLLWRYYESFTPNGRGRVLPDRKCSVFKKFMIVPAKSTSIARSTHQSPTSCVSSVYNVLT
jgi:hypothetical protein